MTHTVLASQVVTQDPEVVEELVQAFREDMEVWSQHHAVLEEEKLVPPPPEPQRANFEDDDKFSAAYQEHQALLRDRRVAFPPPEPAYPALRDAVRVEDGKWIVDYDFKDDLKLTLRQKKDLHLTEVHNREQEVLADLVPPGKVRFLHIRESELRVSDEKLLQDLRAEGQKHASILSEDPDNLAAKKNLQEVNARLSVPEPYLVSQRSPEDNRFLSDYRATQAKIISIQRAAAKMQHDIEDLTEEEVDSWSMGEFD